MCLRHVLTFSAVQASTKQQEIGVQCNLCDLPPFDFRGTSPAASPIDSEECDSDNSVEMYSPSEDEEKDEISNKEMNVKGKEELKG